MKKPEILQRFKKKFQGPLVWIGHYYLAWMICLFSYSIVSAIVAHLLHWNNYLQWVVITPMLLIFFVTVFGMEAHEESLCLKCGEEFPLNPGELAEGKYRSWLKREHWMTDNAKTVAVIFICSLLLTSIVSKYTPFMVAQLFVLAMGATVYLMDRHHILHQKYYPWCPFCDHGGGEVEYINTPDPSGVSQ